MVLDVSRRVKIKALISTLSSSMDKATRCLKSGDCPETAVAERIMYIILHSLVVAMHLRPLQLDEDHVTIFRPELMLTTMSQLHSRLMVVNDMRQT